MSHHSEKIIEAAERYVSRQPSHVSSAAGEPMFTRGQILRAFCAGEAAVIEEDPSPVDHVVGIQNAGKAHHGVCDEPLGQYRNERPTDQQSDDQYVPRSSISAGWEAEEKLTVEEAWTILCETPDITSPEEYPDHALITMEQLGSFMARAVPRAERDAASFRAALEEIANPIAAMQRKAKDEGAKLDGIMANAIARDPDYLKGLARAALSASEVDG